MRKENNKIFVDIPLTTQSGKTRVKVRNGIHECGYLVATRQDPFSTNHYIEWQIGYGVDASDKDKLKLSKLPNIKFDDCNGKTKALYELSEYFYYFVELGFINKSDIEHLKSHLQEHMNNPCSFFDSQDAFKVSKGSVSPPHIQYLPTTNKTGWIYQYIINPMLAYHLEDVNIWIEIISKEKQRAVGIQPMLYVCIPIGNLQPKPGYPGFFGRPAYQNECACLTLDFSYKEFLLETLRIFGTLSANHNHDVWSIVDVISNKLKCIIK